RALFALAKAVPVLVPVYGPCVFVNVKSCVCGLPSGPAGSTTHGEGEMVTPRMVAVSEYGVWSRSDVLRASTSTSHTPGSGFWTVRELGEPGHVPPGTTGGL